MSTYIYCPLTLKPIGAEPEHTVRLGDILNDADVPFEMLYDLHRKAANAVRPVYPTPSAPAVNFPPPPVLQELLGFSTVQPDFSDFASAPTMLSTVQAQHLDMRILSPSETRRYPRAYLMSLCFGEKNGNAVDWQHVLDGDAVLKFQGLIDTGGHANIWMYSNTSAMTLLCKDGPSQAISQSPGIYDRFSREKSKLQFERRPGPSVRLCYAGDETVDLQATTRVCGTYDENHVPRKFLPQFTLGAAVAFDPRLLDAPFDGIIGLGRSYPGRSRLGTPGLLQQLIDQKCIQDEEFYICCRWGPDIALGYGFISFGGWPVDRVELPDWDRIPIVRDAKVGMWIVHLESITVSVPGTTVSHTETINLDVMLDSGASSTSLPASSISALATVVDGISTGQGFHGRGAGLSDNVQVAFTFRTSNAQPSSAQGQSTSRTISGSAKKFFIIPQLGTRETKTPYYPLKFSDGETYNVLGLNFFRTFFVGFIDRASNPAILLAAQM